MSIDIDWTKTERGEKGEWPSKISDEKLEVLTEEIESLLAKYFNKDCDGDWPVEIHIIDRTQYERMHFSPQPYDHKDIPIEQCLDVAALNLGLAMDVFNRLTRLKTMRDKRGGVCKRCDLPTNDGYDHDMKDDCVQALQKMRAKINKAEDKLHKRTQ